MSAFDSTTTRFIDFCDEDGFIWDEAGLHAVLAWLCFLYETTTITGETAEQDVSSFNYAYATMGLQCPAKPAYSYRMFHEVRVAINGLTKSRLEKGGLSPKLHIPTSTLTVQRFCLLVSQALHREDLRTARAAQANVWQYFNFSRPTITANLDWKRMEIVSDMKVKIIFPRITPGKKKPGA